MEHTSETASKRRRHAPVKHFHNLQNEWSSNAELTLIHEALRNSRREHRSEEVQFEEAPVFYPTVLEFANLIEYIKSIEPLCEKYGLARIVPPEGFGPTKVEMTSKVRFKTKLQKLTKLGEGASFADGRTFTAPSFKRHADNFKVACGHRDGEEFYPSIERAYWDALKGVTTEDIQVEYGSDCRGSGFPDRLGSLSDTTFGTQKYLALSSWNIKNAAFSPGSSICHVSAKIPGINQPWLYWGMLFATFCWHVEDLYLPSINYLHHGDAKQWYGIPRAHANKFREVMVKTMKLRLKEEPDLEHAITAMISPMTLNAYGVSVFKATQRAGEFILTFPEAFHSGFSYGFNVGEAANFATENWIPHGARAKLRYRKLEKKEIFSFDRLLFVLSNHLSEFHDPSILLKELKAIGTREIHLREQLYLRGVLQTQNSKVSQGALVGSNISEENARVDDMRVCHFCQATCFLTTVCCKCSATRVSCPRCWLGRGECCDQSLVVEWVSDAQIHTTIKKITKFVLDSSKQGKRQG